MNEKLEKQIDKVSFSRNRFFAAKIGAAIAFAISINTNSNRKMEKIDDFEENFWPARHF